MKSRPGEKVVNNLGKDYWVVPNILFIDWNEEDTCNCVNVLREDT